MIILVIAIYAILTLLTLRNPLIGAGTLWIVMWTYPNNLLYGTFPLNVRFDDLYIVITFLSCIAQGRARLTNSPTLLLSLLWLLVIAIGNINGYLFIGGRSLPEITKLVLKATYVPMIAAILLIQINSFKNFRFILRCMLVAGATTAILGICTVLFPESFQIFLFPYEDSHGTVLDKLELSELIERRARGSVGIVATSLITPITCLLSIVILSIKNNKIFSSLILISIAIISFLGLLYTQSRGPLIGLCLAVLVFFLMLKNGKGLPALCLFLAGVTLFFAIGSPFRDIVLNRFTGGSGEEFGQGVDLRTHIWNTFINNLEPINLVNGLGMVPVKNVYFFTVHNTYLGAIIYGGIWGGVILIMVIARLMRVSGMLAKSHYPYIRQWSVFLPLLLIFLLVTGFSIENFQQTNCMQIFFAILAISEKMPALKDYPNYSE